MRLALLLCAPALLLAQSPTEKAVAVVLDDWHQAASVADETRYFAHMAEDSVFLGTDATERWTKDAFQVWAKPFFKRGKAWSFKAVRRAIQFSANGGMAWFDEDLQTPNMGPCRGSGVLSLEKGRWLIRQYNLSVPIPNDLMTSIKSQIEAHAIKTGPKMNKK